MARPATISKEDVLSAQRELAAAGRSSGVLAVRAALGRGSFSTITKLLEEATDADPALGAPPEAQQSFQLAWNSAYQLGKSKSEVELKQLQKQVSEMALALDTLTGEKEHLLASFEEARRDLSSAHIANARLLETSLAAEERINKSAALSETKDRQIEELRTALEQAVKSAHRIELENARLEGQMVALGSMPVSRKSKNGVLLSDAKPRGQKGIGPDNTTIPSRSAESAH
jgi:chromosome segregation ATPase